MALQWHVVLEVLVGAAMIGVLDRHESGRQEHPPDQDGPRPDLYVGNPNPWRGAKSPTAPTALFAKTGLRVEQRHRFSSTSFLGRPRSWVSTLGFLLDAIVFSFYEKMHTSPLCKVYRNSGLTSHSSQVSTLIVTMFGAAIARRPRATMSTSSSW